MKANRLAQFTKEEIVNAIENGCDYLTYRRIMNYCEMEKLKQADKKLSEQQIRIDETKRLYILGREKLITKYGKIEEIPIDEKIRLLALQQDFLNALNEE